MTGSEGSVGVTAAGIASLLSDTTKTESRSSLGKAIQILSKRNRQAILRASRKYLQSYQATYGQLILLGLYEPVPISSLYTDVNLLDYTRGGAIASATSEDTVRSFRAYASNLEQDKSTSAIAVANQTQYLMVLGKSGAGKSTFLQRIGWDALRTFGKEPSAYHHRLIPVLLALKRIEFDDIELDDIENEQFIEQLIVSKFEQCGLPAAEMFVQRALTQGNLLILLDGLDEVPQAHLGKVLHAIQTFVERYRDNRFIVTGGVAAVGDGEAFHRNRTTTFQRFRKVAIADFDNEQIQQFVGNWFGYFQAVDSKSAQLCWEALQTAEHPASLAPTPLSLTYLCLLYRSSQRLPTSRSQLYQAVLQQILLELLPESGTPTKRRSGDDSAKALMPDQSEKLLAEIAYKGMVANQPCFRKQELSAQITTFLDSHLHRFTFPDGLANSPLNGASVLNALIKLPGLLTAQTQETYAFAQPMLQAYLTAQHAVNNQEWEWLIQLYLTDRRWREVFLLLPALMRGEAGAGPLLLAIEEQSRVYLRSHQLQQLLYWAETYVHEAAQDGFQDSSVQNSFKRSSLVVKRIAAVFLARALTRALALAADMDIAIDLDLALDLDLSLDLALTRALAFARNLARDLALALALDVDLALDLALDLDSALGLDLDVDLDIALVIVRAGVFLEVDWDEWVRSLEVLTAQRPQVNASRAEKRHFIEKFDKLWFSPFGLDSGKAMLLQDDSQALLEYCYACELMIRCKESAPYVGADLWADIESRMFTGVTSGVAPD